MNKKLEVILKMTPYDAKGVYPNILCQNIKTKEIANIPYNNHGLQGWQPVRPEVFLNNALYAPFEKIGLTRMFNNDGLIFESIGCFGVYYPNDRNTVIGFFDTREEANSALTELLKESEFYSLINVNDMNAILKNDGKCFIEGRFIEKGNLTEEGDFIPEMFFKAKTVQDKLIFYIS